jgi:Cu(I)/Ag(I) efflux system membrane fusion protein
VQQNLGVRTALVTRGTLQLPLAAPGSVAFNERDVAVIQARANGYIDRLHVRTPLERVRKGQPLAELVVPDWVAAQEEYLSIKRMQSPDLRNLLDGARQRMRLVGMTDAQIALVDTGGKAQSRLTVTAPVSGVVTELDAREGMTIMAGTPLFKINGLTTVWVNAELPESLAAQVLPGNAVEAQTPALPGAVFSGKVNAILPEVDLATRTVKARVELSNPRGELTPGMFATLRFATDGKADVLLVPSEAVIETGTRSVVMVADGAGRFAPANVKVGLERDGRTEILAGLEAGQQVVVSGQFLIDSEASLRATETRLDAPPAPNSEVSK